MFKFKAMLVAFVAGVFAAGQIGVARATLNCGSGTASKKNLKGNYTLNFSGTEYDEDGDYPFAASGSVTLDGKGNVTGGVINCNIYEEEYTSIINGGCYTVNSDDTGFMTITTTSDICDWYEGVDLHLAISNGSGSQFQFSSDGSDTNFETGEFEVFAGTANKK
jgi:hypothetical protein